MPGDSVDLGYFLPFCFGLSGTFIASTKASLIILILRCSSSACIIFDIDTSVVGFAQSCQVLKRVFVTRDKKPTQSGGFWEREIAGKGGKRGLTRYPSRYLWAVKCKRVTSISL